MPGSAGSRPSASAGSVSVPRSIARICSTVSGSGIGPAGEREDEERHDLGHGVGEDVEDELADVVVDPPPLLDGGDDGGEVVVGEHHRRGLAGHVRAGPAHRDADVGAAQGRGVVDPVAGHRHDVALGLKGVGDAQLGLG